MTDTSTTDQTTAQANAKHSLAETERDELRTRIEARERRIEERSLAEQAREAAAAATDYARANPLQVIGGALVLGLAIGLMTGRGRRVATRAATGAASAVTGAASAVGDTAGGAAKSVGSAAKKRGSRIGNLVADTMVAYGIKLVDEALDAAQAGQDKIEDIGDAASARVRSARREAEYAVGSAADKTRAAGQRTRRRATRAVRDLADRVAR